MAIRSRRNFKTVLGAADLTLAAKTGESLLVTDVKIFEPTAVYANLLIERTSVGFFRVASLLGNHLHFLPGRSAHSHDFYFGTVDAALTGAGAYMEDAGEVDTVLSIDSAVADTNYMRVPHMSHTPSSGQLTVLAYLKRLGIFTGYPVDEGETFTVELCTGATAVKVVEYEIWDAGDKKNTDENGSKSSAYLYLSYGDSGANIQAVADNILAESNNPAEYPDFPFGAVVPSGHKIELIGILASDISPLANATGAATQTDYLKFMHGREVLFDEDHNGLLYYSPYTDALGNLDMIGEGYSVGGNFTQCDMKEPHIFDPAIVFAEGDELVVSWHVIIDTGGAAISQELQEVAMIQRISPMG